MLQIETRQREHLIVKLLTPGEIIRGYKAVTLVIDDNDRRRISRKDMEQLASIGAVAYQPVLSELFGLELAPGWRAVGTTPYLANRQGWARASVGRQTALSQGRDTGLSRVRLLPRVYIIPEVGQDLIRSAHRYQGDRVVSASTLLVRPTESDDEGTEAYLSERLGDSWRNPKWGWDLDDDTLRQRLAAAA